MTETMTLSKYANAKTICALCDISKSSIHKLSKNGEFPAPIKIGRCLRWNVEDVKNWLELKRAESKQGAKCL